jgi:hypothetical protein
MQMSSSNRYHDMTSSEYSQELTALNSVRTFRGPHLRCKDRLEGRGSAVAQGFVWTRRVAAVNSTTRQRERTVAALNTRGRTTRMLQFTGSGSSDSNAGHRTTLPGHPGAPRIGDSLRRTGHGSSHLGIAGVETVAQQPWKSQSVSQYSSRGPKTNADPPTQTRTQTQSPDKAVPLVDSTYC